MKASERYTKKLNQMTGIKSRKHTHTHIKPKTRPMVARLLKGFLQGPSTWAPETEGDFSKSFSLSS